MRDEPDEDVKRTTAAGTIRRFVPIVGWLPRYEKSWLNHDVIAGFTIWGLLIPEMIAYASLAGLPPQAGLYTLLATLMLYAVFGTSRQLVVAGTSASAVLVFSAVTELHPRDSGDYAALAGGVILLAGIFLILAGLFRLGFITQFLSRPVMAGFVFGLAIFVTVSQLPKLFGIDKGEGDTIRQLAHVVAHLGSTSVVTLAVGAAALLVLFGLERFAPRIPGGLVVLVAAISVSALFDLAAHGVHTVGKIPTGLPDAGLPHLAASDLWVLIPSALGMMLVIFSEALGAGTTFADAHGYRIDPNQEMIALGAANLGSGVLGGLAGGGSLSQTAVNDGAGARTQMSPIVAATLSLITVVALTPLFQDLPEAVLAALIIHAVSHLMKVGEMRTFHMLVPREYWLGALTLTSVLVLDVLPALIIGVGASIGLLVYRASQAGISVLGESSSRPGAFENLERHADALPIAGVLIVRPDAPLFYANAQAIRDAVESNVRNSSDGVRIVIIDLDASDELDITSAEHLDKLADTLARAHIELVLAHVHQPALVILRRAELLTKIGDDHVFPNIETAITWARERASRRDAGAVATS
jgi:high affinity sulfate transporter 1